MTVVIVNVVIVTRVIVTVVIGTVIIVTLVIVTVVIFPKEKYHTPLSTFSHFYFFLVIILWCLYHPYKIVLLLHIQDSTSVKHTRQCNCQF